MSLKLILIYYSAVDIQYLILFISVSGLCKINLVIISLKTFYSFIYYCPLTPVLIPQKAIDNTCVEIIDGFRLTNNIYNEQYVCSLQNQCLIFRNLNSIKPFINIFNIGFYGFYYFTTIFHTATFIYSGQNAYTVFSITYVGSADWSLCI